MRRMMLRVAILCALSAAASAQQPPTAPVSFDVASVKPRTGPRQPPGLLSPGRYTNQDTTLLNLIAFAYELPVGQIDGGPEWIGISRFAVNAAAAGTPSMPELRQMVQHLLIDRFRLRTHFESRELSVFSLELERGDRAFGRAMTPSSDPQCSTTSVEQPSSVEPLQPTVPCGMVSVGVGEIYAKSVSMSQFARNLSAVPTLTGIDSIVVDRTQLSGRFDLRLQFRPPDDRSVPPLARDVHSELAVAMREQLGLALRRQRQPVSVLVVDHAEQPAPD